MGNCRVFVLFFEEILEDSPSVRQAQDRSARLSNDPGYLSGVSWGRLATVFVDCTGFVFVLSFTSVGRDLNL